MPELPEVQTIVNDLNKKIKGKKIIDVWTEWPKSFGRSPGGFDAFKKIVKDKITKKIWRIGKNIIFDLSDGKEMLIHQKMTGHLLIGKWQLKNGEWQATERGPLTERVNDYIRTMFFLSGTMMAFSDLRKFGKLLVVDKKNFTNLEDVKNIGPDPLVPRFKADKFISLIRKKRGLIKKILMNQSVVSGIGNIYADEILFIARIHPLQKVEKLGDKDLKNIFNAAKSILKKAIKLRGTSTSDFRDTAGKPGRYGDTRLVYQREGEKCPRCGTKISRIKLGSRSAHFCPICQKLK